MSFGLKIAMVARVTKSARGLTTNTVFIPCAGLGSRLRNEASGFPKPLVEIGGLPAVARVILNYPSHWNFVFAIGYDAEFVRDALEGLFCRDERKKQLSFVYTRSFETPGQGLSHTIRDASEALSGRSFVFHAVDSIIRAEASEEPPTWLKNENQLVLSAPQTPGNYRHPLQHDSGEFGWGQHAFAAGEVEVAYVGICHVYDPALFFARIEELADAHPEAGETLGLNPSDCESVTLPSGTWLDIGSLEGLERARQEFSDSRNILPKSDEAIWFLNSEVVKVHRDPSFIAGRVKRSRVLAPFVPTVHSSTTHTYGYSAAAGVELSEALRDSTFDVESFFDYLWEFWTESGRRQLGREDDADNAYLEFYRDKTGDRVSQLCARFPFMEENAQVNGHTIPPIADTLRRIPWDELATVTNARVHGDLHAENVIATGSGAFVLLDWRQSIAGSDGPIGDVYYDLGKLAHGFRVDHGTVLRGGYDVSRRDGNIIEVAIDSAPGKQEALMALEGRVRDWGLSWNRVLLMEAIIYLNIAPLHQPDSYATLLGLLGRLEAEKALSSWESSKL